MNLLTTRFDVKRAALCVAVLLLAPAWASAQSSGDAAGQDWWTRAAVYRSKYYNIKTDLSVGDAKLMAEHMDATFESYWKLFAKLPVRLQRPATLELYLFAAQADYMQVLQQRFNDDATGSWGKCISRGNSISLVGFRGQYELEQVKSLLQHEGFHQVAAHLFTNLPTWANEGLAEVFEHGIVVDGQLILGDFPAHEQKRIIEGIDQHQAIAMGKLFTMGQSQWNDQVRTSDANMQYLQAWSLVHFMIFGQQGKYEANFLNFLVLLNRGIEWKTAFVAAYGMPDFDLVQTQWEAFVKNLPPTDYRETVRRLRFLMAGLTELHGKGQHPASLDELKQALREIHFQEEVDVFGVKRRLSAADPRVFTVPFAEAAPGRQFVLAPARSAAGPHTPPGGQPATLTAEGLDPQLFKAEWTRRGREASYVLSITPVPHVKARPGRRARAGAAPASKPKAE